MNPSNLSPGQFIQGGLDPSDDVIYSPSSGSSGGSNGPSRSFPRPTLLALARGKGGNLQLGMLYPARDLASMNPLPGDHKVRTAYQDHREYGSDFVDKAKQAGRYIGTPPEGADEVQTNIALTRKEDADEVWARKLRESKDPHRQDGTGQMGPARTPLYDRIAADGGIRQPVHVWSGTQVEGIGNPRMPMIAQGHHRVAAAAAINPAMEVPVYHFDDSNTDFGPVPGGDYGVAVKPHVYGLGAKYNLTSSGEPLNEKSKES